MDFEKSISNIDRRTFLRIISFTGIGGLIYPHSLFSDIVKESLSRVIITQDSSATSGTSINATTTQTMVDASIKALAQTQNIGEAWKSLFPQIDATKIIALKINCVYYGMPTHPEVTFAVANGLKMMDFNGTPFPENNIIIFDRSNSNLGSGGYSINTSATGVRCFGTSASGVGYTSNYYSVNGVNQRISNIITTMADYIVNISVLKNHGTAGVTLCLKNHYGSCYPPQNLHANNCDPYVPALNALPVIKDIQAVNICDGLLGVISGGPSANPQVAPNTIIMSRDIVAADYMGRNILDEYGCSTIPSAHHVDTAAQSPYNLGTNDPLQMDIVNINNPTVSIENDEPVLNPDEFILNQNYPNPFNNNTNVKFYLPKKSDVKMEVFDTHGRLVNILNQRILTKGWHQVLWNGKNLSGQIVASGHYICRLSTTSYQKSIIMQLLK